MSVKAVGQASAHRTDSGSAASGGSGQQQSTMQISVASWVPPLSGDTAEAQFLKSLVTGGLLNRDPNQQIPLDHHVAEVQRAAALSTVDQCSWLEGNWKGQGAQPACEEIFQWVIAPPDSYGLGLISDADVFAYYAETRFDILFRHYARGFWHIIPVLCRKFLKRRASRADLLACLRYVSVEPVIQRTSSFFWRSSAVTLQDCRCNVDLVIKSGTRCTRKRIHEWIVGVIRRRDCRRCFGVIDGAGYRRWVIRRRGRCRSHTGKVIR
jgi:hypothetical protein